MCSISSKSEELQISTFYLISFVTNQYVEHQQRANCRLTKGKLPTELGKWPCWWRVSCGGSVESQPYNCAHVRGVALLRGGKTREIVAKLGLSVWGRIHVHAWTGSSGSTALFVTIGQTDPHSVRQGSFFWLQNTEGLTLVGVFMEGTTLTC
jgi:hypothetical protein